MPLLSNVLTRAFVPLVIPLVAAVILLDFDITTFLVEFTTWPDFIFPLYICSSKAFML